MGMLLSGGRFLASVTLLCLGPTSRIALVETTSLDFHRTTFA